MGNPLQGIEVKGRGVMLQPKAMPGAVVCIACGRNVPIGEIDWHHWAHERQRDGKDPSCQQECCTQPLLAGESSGTNQVPS